MVIRFHIVETTEKVIYFHTFWQNFRESNGFTKEITN